MNKLAGAAPWLAAEFIANLGLGCLRLCPLAGHPGFTRIDSDVARAKGNRLWLRTSRQADKLISEIIAADSRSRRAVGGLVIEADMIVTERQVRHFAALNGFTVIDDEMVTEIRVRTTERIATAVEQMQSEGQLNQLNRTYKTLGSPRPTYNAYLIEHLRKAAQLHPADAAAYGRLIFPNTQLDPKSRPLA